MVGQSFAIIVIILVMAFMFLRAGRRAGALFTLPLISVSVFHLIGVAIHHVFSKSALPTVGLHMAMDLLGLAVGLILCWILSRAINPKKLRWAYFCSCAVFLALLTVAYINFFGSLL